MKNKIFNCLVLSVFLMIFSQCKKDYPDDIPEWIKTEIIKFKKITPDCLCHEKFVDDPGISIYEYVVDGEKVYAFILRCFTKYTGIDVYVYDGVHWARCNDFPQLTVDEGRDQKCLEYIGKHYTASRHIWSGTMY